MSNKKITNSEDIHAIFTNSPVFYKHLIELTPEAIVIHSDGKIVYANPAAIKLIGAKKSEDLIGKEVMGFIHPDSYAIIQKRIKEMLNKKKVAPFIEEKFIDLQGNIILTETKAIPFIFNGKKSIVAIIRNITEKKKDLEQQQFLNNLSKTLSSSIDYKVTINNIIENIVPSLADYSRLILADDNKSITEEIAYHVDPKKLNYVRKLYESYKNTTTSTHGVERILATAKSEILENVNSETFKKYKSSNETIQIVTALGLTSYMGVPLKIHNKVIGALTFSSIRKDRIYSKRDLRFAEEVARRITFALENAILFAQAQKTINAESRLSSIVSYSDDAIISKNLNSIITSWNKSAEKIFGYTAEEAIGKSILIIIPKYLQSEEKKIISNIKSGRHIEHYETVRVRKDGRQIFVSLTISAIRDSHGKIVGASKIARDITEKKKNENELVHLASLVESSSDAIWSSTLDNKILSWNKGAEDMYGHKAKEIIGKNITDINIPSDKIKEFDEIIKKVGHGQYIHGLETTRITKDGRSLDVSMTISPLKDSQGHIVGFSAIVRNITQQKEQEKLKDEFISMASHELKTPITSMKMFLDILEANLAEKKDSAIGIGYVKRIKDQANKMRDLVNDLLDVSRIGTGKMKFNNEAFNLNELVLDIIEGMRPAARKHTLEFKYRSTLPVYGDRFRIYQVVTNLLNNAIKYSPKSNKVVVSAKQVGDQAVISVRDFGIGIAKEQQNKIFDKLYQVTDPEEKTFPGLGMGLYISKEIINGHEGKLWVKSEKGKGSTFSFSLKIQKTN